MWIITYELKIIDKEKISELLFKLFVRRYIQINTILLYRNFNRIFLFYMVQNSSVECNRQFRKRIDPTDLYFQFNIIE